ncbi:MAG: cell division protein SepF [Coriobacteriales bacterium]|nr:cell division protein SepF [Coriobacteriales bacterium]
MGFLDNVKDKLSGLGSGRQGRDNEAYDYDEYDDYRDGYEGDSATDYANDAQFVEEDGYQPALGAARSSYKLDDHPPLISQSDLRSQGVAELQQSARAGAYRRPVSRAPSSSTALPFSAAASSVRASAGGFAGSGSVRVATAPYGSEPTELRGDTPEFYASRSGQVRARGTTGNFPVQSFRQLVLVRPATYSDAEKVAEALKEGHAVAIDLRNTRPELAKRILDFSFGAASVLGGQVETPANRVYAISVGSALTAEEHELLVARGVV